MKKLVAIAFLSVLSYHADAQKTARKYSSLVNPFIGTGGHGHTYPGATAPFGMMQLSPDTRIADWDGSSGYHYSDSVIYGFSHTHLSGTGIPDYCDVLLMPFTGSASAIKKDLRSPFSHKNEKAEPGYYEVLLDRQNIRARLTTTTRAGMHQYLFPKGTPTGSVYLDLKWRDEVLESSIRINGNEISGLRRSKSWASNQLLFFFIRFDQPIKSYTILSDSAAATASTGNRTITGKSLRMAVAFDLGASSTLQVKVGISGVSEEGAKMNLDSEMSHWDFEKYRREATSNWNKELRVVDITGGTRDQQVAFYTALYHCFIVPNTYQDVDGSFRGTDGNVHKANGFTNYSVFSLWDTYRAYHPLMTILQPKRTVDWIQTFLAQYRHGGMLPVWELSGNETFCMIGYHSVPVIADAWQKGLRGFDGNEALQAMISYAESNRFGLDYYRRYGYIPNDLEHESVSKTLEYAYDDWCIAQMAKWMGKDSISKRYLDRARSYQNVFDPSTGHMRGRIQAMWHRPFDPSEINNFYTEGNSWHYSFAVPQDIAGLAKLHGGLKGLSKKLDRLFSTSSTTTGRDQPDVTGLIGQYAQGNEPSHHMAYLYNYTGEPRKTAALINRICKDFYLNAPDGLIGNEDCGQMSAWFIASALGFYPVLPGSGEYVLGTPLFDKATIRLPNGKTFSITANRQKPPSFYVGSVKLNGKNRSQSFITHDQLVSGGSLEFNLTQQPTGWGTSIANHPHSAIEDEAPVPVPWFEGNSNKFYNSLAVKAAHIDPGARISLMRIDSTGKEMPLVAGTVINASATIGAYAELNGKRSKTVYQKFYRLPSDRTISVLSKVHPMYTAGGAESLVDGIEGNTNWRSGEWQSYYDQDFEAVIDLKKSQPLHYLGVHVLQDVSPWILYPKEVIFYASDNGTDFREVARTQNSVSTDAGEVTAQQLGSEVNLNARYIRVKAISGGKLPAWHESAGYGSHLFIDEVIVR